MKFPIKNKQRALLKKADVVILPLLSIGQLTYNQTLRNMAISDSVIDVFFILLIGALIIRLLVYVWSNYHTEDILITKKGITHNLNGKIQKKITKNEILNIECTQKVNYRSSDSTVTCTVTSPDLTKSTFFLHKGDIYKFGEILKQLNYQNVNLNKLDHLYKNYKKMTISTQYEILTVFFSILIVILVMLIPIAIYVYNL